MGLFSDILEECRNQAVDYDPCLFPTGMLFYPTERQQKLKNILSEYHTENSRHRNSEELKRKLLEQAEMLETMKCTYILSEKMLLGLVNSQKFKSDLTQSKLGRLKDDLQKSYKTVCDAIQEIHRELGRIDVKIEAPSESAVKEDVFNLIMYSFVYSIKNSDNAPFDTSSFRQVVADMASVVRYFQDDIIVRQDKKIVYDFLQNQLGIVKSHHQCQNCGELLLKNIPYCLNCYERN